MPDLIAALDALRVGDFQARWEIAKQLEEADEGVVLPLLDLLTEADAELQWFIAQILGSFQQPEAIVALMQLLEAEDEDVSLMAAQQLAKLGSSALEQLADRLQQPASDPRRQLVILRALTQINRTEVVPLLLEAAQTGSAEARLLVFEALDQFQDPRIFAVLRGGLQDANAEVRGAAIAGLAVCEAPAEALVQLLAPFLEDASGTVAEQAARALGRLATDSGALALTHKGCQINPLPLQKTLIQALGWIGSPTALQGLMQIWQVLMEQLPLPERLLQEVLTSLSGIMGAAERKEAAHLGLDLAQSPVLQGSPLKAQATAALGRLAQPSVIPGLISLLEDPDDSVRLHIIAALKQIDSVQAHNAIEQHLKDTEQLDPQLTAGLVMALREW